jgi:uroporphyrinogen decarboxylase
MTKRERVICAIKHRTPDKIPVNDSFWDDTLTRWKLEGMPANFLPREQFDFDIAAFSIDASPGFKPKLLLQDDEFYTFQDRFGYVAKKESGKSRTLDFQSYAAPDRNAWTDVMQMFNNSMSTKLAMIDDIGFPFRLDSAPPWENVRHKFDAIRADDYYILASAYGPHEATWRLHGFTETLMDISTDPKFILEIASVYLDNLINTLQRCSDEGVKPDGFLLVDDVAFTQGMLFSPNSWRQIYKPVVKKLGGFLKKIGVHFWMHSCANCEPIFNDLIECGLEVLNPLEVKSGLDVCELKEQYGDQLCFYGNIDVRNMSADSNECESEIKRKLSNFEQGGGYIYHSDHSIPPEVSYSQYKKVLEYVRKYGG